MYTRGCIQPVIMWAEDFKNYELSVTVVKWLIRPVWFDIL